MRSKGVQKRFRVLLLFAFLIVWTVTVRFVFFPPFKAFRITGKYEIASCDYWVNEDRADPYHKDGRLRQVQVRKWYPLECDGSFSRRLSGLCHGQNQG